MVPEPRSVYAVQFVLLGACLLAMALACSWGLFKLLPPDTTALPNRFSPAFVISTCLLLLGSFCMYRAVDAVRHERQTMFRNWLKLALAAGTLFVTTQTFALAILVSHQSDDEATSGASSAVAACAFMHGMHFVIALLFLSYVLIQAQADRYDHEYFWGVFVCAWFWHLLGIGWLVIVCVMIAARLFS